MKIETLLQRKGSAVVTVKPGATIAQAVELLRSHRIGCLVVSGALDGSLALHNAISREAA